MTTPITQIIEQRTSTNHFDPSRPLDPAVINELVRLATRAPSSFNAQNWRFVAVTSPAARLRLKALSFDQQKVEDAPVTFIVVGRLFPFATLGNTLQASHAAGILDEATVQGWVGFAQMLYGNNETFRRDEAIRSAALAGMTLMLAAQGHGLASAPLNGFDPAGVAGAFGLANDEVPAMLVSVGYPAAGNWPAKPRLPLQDVLSFA